MNQHNERAELIKDLRDLADIDFDNLFLRAAAMLEAQPAEQAKGQAAVAWRAWFDADNGARWLFSLWPEEERLDVEWQPLYTTPPAQPAREWAWLTEFEIASAMTGQPEVGISFQALCSIARAIESASREKNAGLAAAVPDAMTPDRAHEAAPKGFNYDEAGAWMVGWNDCRDAMLAAAPKPQDDLPAILKKQAS